MFGGQLFSSGVIRINGCHFGRVLSVIRWSLKRSTLWLLGAGRLNEALGRKIHENPDAGATSAEVVFGSLRPNFQSHEICVKRTKMVHFKSYRMVFV